MVPNYPWDVQDNVYGSTGCGETINYQNVAATWPGTEQNGVWAEGDVYYPYCFSTTYHFYYYNTVGGNLNSGTVFETWYSISSQGYPTTAWLTVYPPGGGVYTYSSQIPSNPNVVVDGWEDVIVCYIGGCNVQFSGGGGTMYFYQSHLKQGQPNYRWVTGETSNCNYGPVFINVYDNLGTQSFSCP